jgi:predicted RNA methylase
MSHPQSSHELSQAQVSTPESVVKFFWKLIAKSRPGFEKVLDVGAGDCRFGFNGATFGRYVGIEIDQSKVKSAQVPSNGRLIHGCAFKHREGGYDAFIGNPPYVRSHDLESPWRDETVQWLNEKLDISLNRRGNLFLYFLCLGFLKIKRNGLIALVIPYEWVTRPSAKPVRDFIRKNRWKVDVYRFSEPIFDEVLTTASISLIDTSCRSNEWNYFDVSSDFRVTSRRNVVGSRSAFLSYSKRGQLWAMRGLSTGSQAIFTLTEEDRLRYKLSKRDVRPCVTSLRHLPKGISTLTQRTFRKHFIEAGRKCWLIKSNSDKRSAALNAYLESIPKKARSNYTCNKNNPWFKFSSHPVPRILVASGFTSVGPKIVANSIQAIAVGTVYGVHGSSPLSSREILKSLKLMNFESQVVHHAGALKKLEVGQLNAALNDLK